MERGYNGGNKSSEKKPNLGFSRQAQRKDVCLWTRIFHVHPHSMARLIFIGEKLVLEKLELPLILFYFILKEKIKQERKP